MKRAFYLGLALALVGGGPLVAQDMDEEEREVDGGVIPEGWMVRTDQDRPLDNVRVVDEMGAVQVDNGPAVVLWRDDFRARGEYTVSGTFTQVSSKGHPHGTGLVVGGRDLSAPGQVYTYFLVRGDGHFIVKTRTGSETANLSPGGWVAHDAVRSDDANGQYTNRLEIQVAGGDMIFRANGTEVFRSPTSDLYADGLYGVRMNHNLTIRFSDLEVHAGM